MKKLPTDNKSKSWIVIAPRTERIVGEIYDKRNAQKLLDAGYIVMTAHKFLTSAPGKWKTNPAPRYDNARLVDAADLYRRFTGMEPDSVMTVPKPHIPREGVVIGKILGIMYETVRDGVKERYKHEFAARSRPLFVVSHDGKQLIMLGGAYDFTERGIVDRRK